MVIGSTSAGGGALRIRYDFSAPLRLVPAFRVGGVTLYTATDPGFDVPARDEPQDSFYSLVTGTQVRLQLVAADSGASIKIGGSTLDQPGESASLGTMPNIHVHPEWRLVLPDGTVGRFLLSFKLTTSSRRYGESAVYEVVLQPHELQTPTGTLTPSPTLVPSPTPSSSATASATPAASVSPSASPTSTSKPTPSATLTPSLSATRQPPSPSPLPTVLGDENCDRRISAADLVALVCYRSDPPACTPCDGGGSGPAFLEEARLLRALFEPEQEWKSSHRCADRAALHGPSGSGGQQFSMRRTCKAFVTVATVIAPSRGRKVSSSGPRCTVRGRSSKAVAELPKTRMSKHVPEPESVSCAD